MKQPSNKLQKQAEKAQQAAEQSRIRAARAEENMRQNFAANLGVDAPASAIPGGTADLVDSTIPDTLKKRKQGAGLSSTLGITV